MFEWINPWITGSFTLVFGVLAAILIIKEMTKSVVKRDYKVYLAGPEVFLPDAKDIGQRRIVTMGLMGLGKSFHLEGLFPLDNEVEPSYPEPETADIIFGGNVIMMQSADFIIANMMPFQSPSMDVGTAFEMGYMFHSGKPVFGYYDTTPFPAGMDRFTPDDTYIERVRDLNGLSPDAMEHPKGVAIEEFGLGDNLMMACAIRRTGYPIANSYEEAVSNIIDYLMRKTNEIF